jgi:hypothetical protein
MGMPTKTEGSRAVTVSISMPPQMYLDLRRLAAEKYAAGDTSCMSSVVRELIAPPLRRATRARGEADAP